jgi:hypothetical protein
MPLFGSAVFVLGLVAAAVNNRVTLSAVWHQRADIGALILLGLGVVLILTGVRRRNTGRTGFAIFVVGAATYTAYRLLAIVPAAWVAWVVPVALGLAVLGLAVLSFAIADEFDSVPFSIFVAVAGAASYVAIRFFSLPPDSWRDTGKTVSIVVAASGVGLAVLNGLARFLENVMEDVSALIADGVIVGVVALIAFDLPHFWAATITVAIAAGVSFIVVYEMEPVLEEFEEANGPDIVEPLQAAGASCGVGAVALFAIASYQGPGWLNVILGIIAAGGFLLSGLVVLLTGWTAGLSLSHTPPDREQLTRPGRVSAVV